MLTPTRILRAQWSSTLRIPKSSFPPRPSPNAEYLRRCTDDLYQWQKKTRDNGLRGSNTGAFVLHDGPPYANGPLHIGHALNKITKDIICRYQIGQGKLVDYIPGWDCHGLPIELKALQSQKNLLIGEEFQAQFNSKSKAVAVRRAARALATRTITEQMKGFKEWAVMGDWDNAYKTMNKDFEIRQLEVFKKMHEKGLIHRQFKPVYWSPSSHTALAEAELEYDEKHVSRAAFIKFPVKKPASSVDWWPQNITELEAVIWTTTPWTIPANKAIAVHRDMEYSIVCVPSISSQVSSDNKPFIVATSRVPHLETFLNEGKLTVVHSGLRGADLAACGLEYYQPFSGEWNPMIHADFVSDSSGSGLVHLAPGHGMDDYNACTKLGIDAFAPVDDEGRYTAAAFPSDSNLLEGLSVQKEGVDAVLNYLGDQNRLFAVHKITHKYPIDWRTKEPVIIRATKQWFANVDGIKDDVLRALQNVTFIPESGRTRLESFVQGRSQWCISRQRAWGVPIPALYRVGQNGEADAIVDSDTIQHIIDVIKRDGIDSWWSDPEDDSKWVPSRFEGQFVRGSETMDVWFDSGTSWTLLPERNDKPVADVYLEGTDQHRGWFQSSLLTHVATKDTPANSEIKAPFDTLITHGFTLDSDGRKMSKSLGNVISPGQIMEGTLLPPQKMKKVAKHDAMGADALRLWVASSDYTRDVAIGEPVLKAVQTNLHKYRVTFKWILGILSLPKCPPPFPDFQTNKSLLQETSSGPLIDKIILTRLSQVSTKVRALYSAYEFSRGTSIVNTFIFNDLSAFYFETLKDRIYTGSLEDCKTAQEVLGVIFYELLQMLAPICPLLVEEVWDHLPQSLRESSVHPAKIIWTPFTVPYDVELIERQASTIQHLSASIKHCQETLRQDKKIGSGLETDVLLGIPDKISHPADLQLFFGPNGPHDEAAKQAAEEQLAAIFVVSSVKIMSPEQVIARSEGMKDTGDSVRSSYGPEDIHSLEIVEVVVQKAEKCKCPRCWRFVAEEPEQLCRRCGDVVP